MDGANLMPEAYLGWHQIQESLSRLTGLEFALYNGQGQPVGMVSGESPFCRSIRRGGKDSSFCDSQCGRFIREAVGREGATNFKCASGQSAFLIPVRHGDVNLVISGGKTFADRNDYKKALRMVKAAGGKLSVTGKHKYRYIGKRRLTEVMALVQNAAVQHFQNSHQKFAYQLRHNRQAALLESVGLLYREKGTADIAESLLRSVTALFEAGTASLIFYGGLDPFLDAHYVVGEREDEVRAAGPLLVRAVREALRDGAGEYALAGKDEALAMGLPEEAAPVMLIPFRRDGVLFAALCLYGPSVKPDDIPALKTYITQSAAIIENRGLKDLLGDKIERLRTLVTLGSRMSGLSDPDKMMKFIFDQSAELLQAERGSLMLLNHKTEELIIKVSRGLSEEMGREFKLKAGEGIAGKVAREGAPIVVEDLEKSLAVKQRPNYRTKSFMSLPLKVDGRVIGVINLADKISGKVFSNEDLDLISSFASQASVALEKAMLEESVRALEKKSIYDPLTGLLNRGYLRQRLSEEWDRARRYKKRFTLMLIGLSGGEDAEGQEKDEVFKAASETVRAMVRANDIVGRLGGYELALILPETAPEPASILAGRMQKGIGELTGMTLAVGMAGYPEDANDPEGLLDAARKSLVAGRQ